MKKIINDIYNQVDRNEEFTSELIDKLVDELSLLSLKKNWQEDLEEYIHENFELYEREFLDELSGFQDEPPSERVAEIIHNYVLSIDDVGNLNDYFIK